MVKLETSARVCEPIPLWLSCCWCQLEETVFLCTNAGGAKTSNKVAETLLDWNCWYLAILEKNAYTRTGITLCYFHFMGKIQPIYITLSRITAALYDTWHCSSQPSIWRQSSISFSTYTGKWATRQKILLREENEQKAHTHTHTHHWRS